MTRFLIFAAFAILIVVAMALPSPAGAQQNPTPTEQTVPSQTPPPPSQAPPPARLPRDGFPAGPAAKILSFTAAANAIKPGESVALKWAVLNADKIALDHGIGVVAARGSRIVSPKRTTTYKLTALGYGAAGSGEVPATVTVMDCVLLPAAPYPSAVNL